MADKIDLSIIIVNYNTKALLRQCLESLGHGGWDRGDGEIIIVDNGSTDGSVEWLRSLEHGRWDMGHPTSLILNKKNLGFAKANNQGLRQARGKYILFLNPDTVVLDQAPLKMVQWLEKHPKVGVLGCQILDEDKKVRSSGGFFPNLWRVFLWMSGVGNFPLIVKVFGAYHSPPSFFKAQRKLDWVQGCALLTRKEAMEKIGGFDENFFMYAEEIDLCLRAKKAGWQVWFTPKAQIVHLGGKKAERPILGEYKGLLYFFKKHFSSWHLSVLKLLLRFGAVLRISLFGIIGKDEKLKEIYLQAYQLAG